MQISLHHTRRSGTRSGSVVVLIGFLAVLSGTLLVGCGGPQISDKDIRFIDTVSLNELVVKSRSNPDEVLLIDPRREVEFETAHLPGAVNIQLPDLDASRGLDPRIESYRNKVVYGQNPGSAIARAMAKRLLSMGYEKVRMYEPGLDGWFRAGLPVESDREPGVNDPE